MALKPQYNGMAGYDTPLSPQEQQYYNNWVKQLSDNQRNTSDYDLTGYFLAALGNHNLDANGMPLGPSLAVNNGLAHLDDVGKKPWHPTFSTGSKYHGVNGNEGGVWKKIGIRDNGEPIWEFTPSATNMNYNTPQGLARYWNRVEQGNILKDPRVQGVEEPLIDPVDVAVGGAIGLAKAVPYKIALDKGLKAVMQSIPARRLKNGLKGASPLTIDNAAEYLYDTAFSGR